MPHYLTDRALPETLPAYGVLVLESHHSPDFEMEWRTHPFVKIIFVLQGEGTFHIGQDSETFFSGDVFLVPPDTPNRIVDNPSSAASLYVCCIADPPLRLVRQLLDRLGRRVCRGDGHFANRVASILRRMVHAQESDSPTRPVAMVADALKLVLAVDRWIEKPARNQRETSNERAVVNDYIQSLPAQFFDETTIDAAANQLGIRRRTFTKWFTEITGETWLQHIRRLAIEHAKRRLRQTDLPIVSVAFECGFNDLSTFYRQFKKQCGMAPGEYRSSTDSIEGVG